MPTPGLLFVQSHLLPNTDITDEQYNHFYNTEHLPDVLNSGIHGSQKVALRYKNTNPSAQDPYLALYPVEDVSTIWDSDKNTMSGSFLELAEMNIAKSLGNKDIYTIAAFTPRIYEKIQTYEAFGHENQTGHDRGQTIVVVAMEPGHGKAAEDDFEDWYRKQHLDMLGMCKGYRRCTRYRRLDFSTDGTGDVEGKVIPRYLALHEYACTPEELPAEQIKQVVGTEWTKKILGEAKAFERDVVELVFVGGDGGLKL